MVSEPGATNQAAAADETASRIAFKPDTLRRAAVTAAVLTIAALLSYVPAPGLSPDAITHLATATGDSAAFAVSRLSIVALGLSPILSALIAGEVLKLAAPPLYGLEDDSSRAHVFNRAILILGLFFAAFQAYGITVALEQIQLTGGTAMVEEPGAFFRLSYMMTLVAGVALMYWLAGIITRHGIGSGFWVMLLSGELWAVPAAVKTLAANHAMGQIGTEVVLTLVIAIAAAVFSIVALYRLRFTPADVSSPLGQLAPRDIMMPPLLGTAIASTLMMAVPLGQFLTGDDSTLAYSFNPAGPVWLILCAAMILLIAFLRSAIRPLGDAAGAQAIRWALIAGAITATITVALEVLNARLGIQLMHGTWLIILVVVCLVFLSSQREPPASEREDAAANAET